MRVVLRSSGPSFCIINVSRGGRGGGGCVVGMMHSFSCRTAIVFLTFWTLSTCREINLFCTIFSGHRCGRSRWNFVVGVFLVGVAVLWSCHTEEKNHKWVKLTYIYVHLFYMYYAYRGPSFFFLRGLLVVPYTAYTYSLYKFSFRARKYSAVVFVATNVTHRRHFAVVRPFFFFFVLMAIRVPIYEIENFVEPNFKFIAYEIWRRECGEMVE